MDQFREMRIRICKSDTVPYPDSLVPKGLNAVPCCFDPWNFCCPLILEIISRIFDIYKVLNIFRRKFIHNFKNFGGHLLHPQYMEGNSVRVFQEGKVDGGFSRFFLLTPNTCFKSSRGKISKEKVIFPHPPSLNEIPVYSWHAFIS